MNSYFCIVAILKKIRSYLLGVKEKTYSTPLNETLEVWFINGRHVLHSANANYSFDTLHSIFQETFSQIGLEQINPKKVLILGFGAGSIVCILQKELQLFPAITAVEHDETILQIGKEYFNTSSYKNLDIVCADAFDFVATHREKYDLLVIDLFNDCNVPDKFLKKEFIDHCLELLEPKATLVFNFINESSVQKEGFNQVYNYLASKNGEIKNLPLFGTNIVAVFTKNN